jgi:hypothetical protein
MEKQKIEITEELIYTFLMMSIIDRHRSLIPLTFRLQVMPSTQEVKILEFFEFIKIESTITENIASLSMVIILDKGKKFVFDGSKIPKYLFIKDNSIVEISKEQISVFDLVKDDMSSFHQGCWMYNNSPNKAINL